MKYSGLRFFPGLVFLFILSLTAKCRHKSDITDFPEMCFARDILPIFQNNCSMAGCHDGTGESDLRLRSYSEIINGIEPGYPENSAIYRAITGSGEGMMPPRRPLSIDNRTKIRVWIEQGALLKTCPAAK